MFNLSKNAQLDTESIWYFFGIASWQAILAIVLLIGAFLFIFFYKRSKRQDKKLIFTVSFMIGILIGLIFLLIYSYTEPPPPPSPDVVWITWVDEVINIFSLITSIYFSFLIFVIPLLIFTALVVVINKDRHDSNISYKSFIISFVSLLLMAVIGILVGLAIMPLIKMIDLPDSGSIPTIDSDLTNSTIPGIINSSVPSSLAVFGSISIILAIVFLGVFMGFVLRRTHREHHIHGERAIRFFEKLQQLIVEYIKLVSILLPYAIVSRIPIIFIGDFFGNILNLSLFMGIFLLGWFLINGLESSIAIFSMKKHQKHQISNFKLFFTTVPTYWTEAFTKINSSVLLPYTIDTSLKLKASEQMGHLTPTLGTTMGQSMCAAFYPTFIAIMSANLSGLTINFQFIFILIIIVLITNIGVTGIPGADSTLNLIVLGTLGLSPGYYVNILLIEPFLDPIRTVGNATGFVAATLLSSKISEKFLKKK